jgi:paraquat-inducible protein B
LSATHKSQSEFPSAVIKKRAKLSLIWLVPAVAAIVAAVLVFQNVKKIGPTITIRFEDGGGLQANQTVVRYRGVQVGSLRSVELTKDTKHVEAVVRLNRSASRLARTGTIFWVVRPEVGAAGLRGLETIVSGVYIQAQPGKETGPEQKQFVGLEDPPVIPPPLDGIEYVLRTPANASLNEGSPIYYRGIEVGSVRYLQLSADSTTVDIHVSIKTNFAPLVRNETEWWNAGGIKVNFHFFGIDVGAENFKSLIVGGIAFATPTNYSSIAQSGKIFPLHDKSEEKWLKWSPVIPITNANPVAPTGGLPSLDLNQPQKQ